MHVHVCHATRLGSYGLNAVRVRTSARYHGYDEYFTFLWHNAFNNVLPDPSLGLGWRARLLIEPRVDGEKPFPPVMYVLVNCGFFQVKSSFAIKLDLTFLSRALFTLFMTSRVGGVNYDA